MNERDADQTPIIGAIALVRRWVNDQEQWLALRDENEDSFRFPQSTRTGDETYRSSLQHVLETELNLSRKRDFIISSVPRLHFQAPVEFGDATSPRWVIIEFFVVELHGPDVAAQIDGDERCHWLTTSEVVTGYAHDGGRFHPRQHLLIERTEIFGPAAA